MCTWATRLLCRQLALAGHRGARLRDVRARRNLQGMFQIHHVIPKSLQGHSALRECAFDVHASYNLMPMITRHGMAHWNVRATRLIHDGGHPAYNRWVRQQLDGVRSADELERLLVRLHAELRADSRSVPWP